MNKIAIVLLQLAAENNQQTNVQYYYRHRFSNTWIHFFTKSSILKISQTSDSNKIVVKRFKKTQRSNAHEHTPSVIRSPSSCDTLSLLRIDFILSVWLRCAVLMCLLVVSDFSTGATLCSRTLTPQCPTSNASLLSLRYYFFYRRRIVRQKIGLIRFANMCYRPPEHNPFYTSIDSMPDIRPRRKSIPLVSELVRSMRSVRHDQLFRLCFCHCAFSCLLFE